MEGMNSFKFTCSSVAIFRHTTLPLSQPHPGVCSEHLEDRGLSESGGERGEEMEFVCGKVDRLPFVFGA